MSSISYPIFEELKTKFNYTDANLGACPFILNATKVLFNKETNCNINFQNNRLSIIPQKPSIIILGGRYQINIEKSKFENLEGDGEKLMYEYYSNNGKGFEFHFNKTIKELIKLGHHIILIYPIPEVGINVPKNMYKNIKGMNLENIKDQFSFISTDYKVFENRTKSTFKIFDSINSPNLYRVYPHKLFCNKQMTNRCVGHDKKDVFYYDDDRPSIKGSEMIAKLVLKKIEIARKNILEKSNN